MGKEAVNGESGKRLTARLNENAVVYVGKYMDHETGDIPDELTTAAVREVLKKLADYEDSGLDPEKLRSNADIGFLRIIELLKADSEGKIVILPFRLGKTLVDYSDPERPELFKNFRVALAYDHSGIVFHQPLNIFLENVQKGYIREVSEEAETAWWEAR